MVELNFARELPKEIPSRLSIYSIKRPEVDQTSLMEIASKLKLSDKHPNHEFTKVGDLMILKQGSYIFSMNVISGALRFRNTESNAKESQKTFDITEERLKEIAFQFIAETRLLSVPASRLRVGKIAYLRTQAANINGEMMPEQILDGTVIVNRDIDGIPVSGPGGLAMINIASDEKVIAVSKIWREIESKVDEDEILEPSYAIEELHRRLSDRKLGEALVNVIKADFCYFEAGANDHQSFFEPTYAFVFETKINQFPYKSTEVIPGIKNPRQFWKSQKRFTNQAMNRGYSRSERSTGMATLNTT